MRTIALLLTITSLASADADAKRDAEKKREAVIDRFILADTGRLAGKEAKQAADEFDKLGVEAVPALLHGLGKSAKLDHSCPVLMISKKLARLLLASDDEKLVEFARDEIGAEMLRSSHGDTLRDLRVRLAMHQNALAKRPPIPAAGVGAMTAAALMRAVPKTRGEQLKSVLRELGQRDEKEATIGLSLAAVGRDVDAAKLAREMLDAQTGRMGLSLVKQRLEEGGVEAKRSAVRVAREKHVELTLGIIERMADESAAVRAEARAAMRSLGEGKVDFGPEPTAGKEKQREAQKKWRDWWLGRAKE